jgi:hypothetical protein
METTNEPKVNFVSTKIEKETLQEIVNLGHILRNKTKLPHPNYAVIRLGIALLAEELSKKRKQEE